MAETKEKNVIIFGRTGVGKSSTINLLTGMNQARVSHKTDGVTKLTQWLRAHDYAIHDTPGLSEGKHGAVSEKESRAMLHALISKLSQPKLGGIHLLLMVMSKEGIDDRDQERYKTFVKDACASKVPTILFITHFDFEEADVAAKWLADNMNQFSRRAMDFRGFVLGSAANPEVFGDFRPSVLTRRECTKKELLGVMDKCALKEGWTKEESWIFSIFMFLGIFFAILFSILGFMLIKK